MRDAKVSTSSLSMAGGLVSIWSLIDTEEKRARLVFIGAGLATGVSALWAFYVYINPPKPTSTPSTPNVAIGSITNSTISVLPLEQGQSREEIVKEFRKVLYSINELQMQKGEAFDPHLRNYIRSPDEENWRFVQSDAKELFDKIKSVLNLARSYDARFVVHRDKIISLTGEGEEITSIGFEQQFINTRKELQKRAMIIEGIKERKSAPSTAEARAMVSDLQKIYSALWSEMNRLLDLIDKRT